MRLTNEDVAEILRLLDAAGYDELRVATAEFRLTLARTADGDWTREQALTREASIERSESLPERHTSDPSTEQDRARGEPDASPAASVPDPSLAEVRSPLPGTFYRAPRPGAEPFVEIGSTVEPETVIGIVETMKLMNSIHAGVTGVVDQIAIDNAQSVVQGAVLMRIRAAGA